MSVCMYVYVWGPAEVYINRCLCPVAQYPGDRTISNASVLPRPQRWILNTTMLFLLSLHTCLLYSQLCLPLTSVSFSSSPHPLLHYVFFLCLFSQLSSPYMSPCHPLFTSISSFLSSRLSSFCTTLSSPQLCLLVGGRQFPVRESHDG